MTEFEGMETVSLTGNRRNPPYTPCRAVRKWVKEHLLLVLTLIGILFGFAIGFGVRPLNPSQTALIWLGMPGDLFIRMLKLMILPLIVSSVISGTASLDPKSNGRISMVALIYIVITNLLGCVIGAVLALILKPGVGVSGSEQSVSTPIFDTQDVFADLLRNLVPDNIVEVAFVQTQTQNKASFVTVSRNTSGGIVNETVRVMTKSASKISGTNLLGVITVSMVLGVATGLAKESGKPFLCLCQSIADVTFKILRFMLWLTPIGICSLIVSALAEIKDVKEMFNQLGLFVAVVTIGIIILHIVVLPLIIFVITRRNPFKFFVDLGKAWMIAFATTSTAAAIPEMFSACENGQKVDKRVSRFAIPFAVTLNADGSALYMVVAAMFICNLTGVALGAGNVVIIVILTTILSMTLPSVPSASIVTLVMILTPLNVPVEGISLLFAVEWFLDRIRTGCNLVSHTTCALVTYQFCRDILTECDKSSELELTVTSDNAD